VTKHNPDFRVTPRQGLVPANGRVEIEIEFTPLNFGTCAMEITLHISQFNSKPIVCTVTGSCVPGMVRRREIEIAATKLLQAHGGEMTIGAAETLSPKTFGMNMMKALGGSRSVAVHGAAADLVDMNLDEQAMLGQPRPKGTGSGAVLDGGADLMSARAVSVAHRLHHGGSPRDVVPTEHLVDGLLIPAEVTTNVAVNYIITQQPGKLKPKALSEAIERQRADRAVQKAAQEALRSEVGGNGGTGLSVHTIKAEESSLLAQKEANQSRQLRELAFLQDLNEMSRDEKEREFKSSHDAVGGTLLTPEEVDAAVAQRDRVSRRMGYLQREADRATVVTVARGPHASSPLKVARAETFAHIKPDYFAPTFNQYDSDIWCKRRTTLQRFVFLVSKWIVRQRASRRLAAIKARLGGSTTRAEVRVLVELDNQQVQRAETQPTRDSGKASLGAPSQALSSSLLRSLPASPLRFNMPDGAIQPAAFPCFEENSSTVRLPVATARVHESIGFQDLAFFGLKLAQEAAVMGYVESSPPSVDSYAPRRNRQGVRIGAVEESGVRAPRDAFPGWNRAFDGVPSPESDADVAPPSGATDPQSIYHHLFSSRAHEGEDSTSVSTDLLFSAVPSKVPGSDLLRPTSTVKAFAHLATPVETDHDWALRPQSMPLQFPQTYGCRLASSVGTSSLHAYSGVPTLSSHWRPRRQRRPSALLCLREQHQQLLWLHEGLPLEQFQRAESDAMSDSESDDDGDDDFTIPTMDLARGFFDPDFESYQDLSKGISRDRQLLKLEASNLDRQELAAVTLFEVRKTAAASEQTAPIVPCSRDDV